MEGRPAGLGWRGAVGSQVEARTGLSTALLKGGPGTGGGFGGALLGLPFSDPAPCLKGNREPTEKRERQRQASPGLLDRCPPPAPSATACLRPFSRGSPSPAC